MSITNEKETKGNEAEVPQSAPVSDSSASSVDYEPTTPCNAPYEVPAVVGGASLKEVAATRRVSFGSLEMRKYPIILGDHPDCAMGPPVTIGWNHCKSSVMPVDVYESRRRPRRGKEELQMGWIQRKQILRSLRHASDTEMREAACEALHVREQRNQTVSRLRYEFIEVPLESLGRKVKRAFQVRR